MSFSFSVIGLDLENCVGQGYDGCSTMSGIVTFFLSIISDFIKSFPFLGHIGGCQAFIKEKYLRILYIHCDSHSFNLALSDSCDIRAIQNTIGTIKET